MCIRDSFYSIPNKKRPGHDVWELIDLEVDPLEQTNFYDDPAYAEVQAELHKELERLRKELKATEPDPDLRKNAG